MTLQDVIDRGRRKAARRYTETCIVTVDPAGTSNDTLDPVTLRVTAGPVQVVWIGMCAISEDRRVGVDVGRSEDAPVAPDPDAGYRGRFPHDAPQLTIRHTVRVTASSSDPRLVDRQFRVARDSAVGSLQAQQRVPLRAVRAPGLP